MKKLFTFILLFTGIMLTQSCGNSENKPLTKDASYYLNNSTIVADCSKSLMTYHSLNELSKYMSTTYGLQGFLEVYSQAIPYLKGVKTLAKDERLLSSRVSSTDTTTALGWGGILAAAGISNTSHSYEYVNQVLSIFRDSTSVNTNNVIAEVNSIKSTLENDVTLSNTEKTALVSVSNMLINNYEGLVNIISSSTSTSSSNGRVSCWICSIFNVVVSVIVTTVAVAVAFLAVSGMNPIAGIVGAIIGFAYSTYQATQGKYYSFSCGDDEAFGLKSCTTGACV